MGLTSRILLVVVGLAALGVPALAVYGWNRLPGTRALRVMERLSLFVLSQGLAVLLALLAVNDQYQFFVSWRDLLGSPPKPGLIAALGDESFTGPYGSVSVFNVRRTQSKDGELISETVRGDRAHLTGRILISLPPGYTSGHRSYPVLELLQGWHAPPESWLTNLHVLDAIRAAERAGRLAPVITVMPDINLGAPRDTECTNIPHGPQTETFLTTDVRDLLLAQYRALPYGKSWGLMGFSTGGYCAAKLALNHPDWYPSAVVMSGYFDAIKDRSTGDLWGGSQMYRNENSPNWLIQHQPRPAIDLLAFASRFDRESYSSTSLFLKLPHSPLHVFSLISPRGGHNFKALRAALPEMLDWIGARVLDRPPLGAAVG
jgi:S-formylglutathione hydrolase FrmB